MFGGGGGGLVEGWTGPGELAGGGRATTLGLALGRVGLTLGGGGAPLDLTEPRALLCVGVGPTGLGLGDKLGDEF